MIPCSPHLFTADSTMIVLIFPSFVPTIFKRGSFIKLLTLFIHDFNSHGSMNLGQNSFFWKAHGFDDLSRIVNYTDSCGCQLTAPWSRGSTTVNTDSKLALEVLRMWIPTQVVQRLRIQTHRWYWPLHARGVSESIIHGGCILYSWERDTGPN